MFRKMLHLLEDPKIDYTIPQNTSFNNYIQKCRHIIESNRKDLEKNPEKTITANMPFEMIPPCFNESKKRIGVLLIHGLFDSPFVMKDMAARLHDAGYLIKSVLLPGHGTIPGALLNVTFEEWVQTVKYGVDNLKKEVDHLFIIGFSTGGALALQHAIHDPSIAGIGLLCPAIKINSAFDFTANWHRILSWKWEKAKWFYLDEESDYVKYSSITYNSIFQVFQLAKLNMEYCEDQMPKCPIFMVLNYNDKVVSSHHAKLLFRKNINEKSKLIIYSDIILKEQDPRITFRDSKFPEKDIYNFCHVSIPFTCENPHYGIHGDFPEASHIEENKSLNLGYRYGAIIKPEQNRDNLLYKLKLKKYRRRRLTFNPDFEYMISAMQNFIETVLK